MGIDVHAYKTGIMIYMKDEWAEKKGDELTDTEKWKIFGVVYGVPQ